LRVQGATPRERRRAADAEKEASSPRSKADTQQRILGAALSLFTERGYDRTHVRAVAARAGVSHAAVFWHFGNKQRLFFEVSRLLLRPFLEQLAKSLQQDDPSKRLFDLFAVYEQFVTENREAIQNMVRWVLESQQLRALLEGQLLVLHESFAHDVRETVEQLVDEPTQAAELSAALVSLLHGNLLLSLIDSSPAAQHTRRAGLRALAGMLLQPRLPAPAKAGSRTRGKDPE
jgi:AcrR family transcriptional regulator